MAPPGALVVVGGGGTPDEVVQRALELAGGKEAKVAVLPFASRREDRGIPSCEMWREAGAHEVWNLDDPSDGDPAQRLNEADLIWMPGGSQSRLMEALDDMSLTALIRTRHADGVVVGGTSAGAAVMSFLMIAGPPREEGLLKGRADQAGGLGLWPGVIVDQHFVQRDRYGRLLSAVMDHPKLLGIGISERTAALVTFRGENPAFEVLGESHIIVMDAGSAKLEEVEEGELHGARGIQVDVLPPGQKRKL